MSLSEDAIADARASSYTVPTDAPEADGTLQWSSTTLVLVDVSCGGVKGLGYSYGNKAAAVVASHLCAKCIQGKSPMDIPRLRAAMVAEVRNDGSRGIASVAISAIDIALWDLKAKLMGCSVTNLLGSFEHSVAVYGSGGFTSYSDDKLQRQLCQWAHDGIKSVKMKIGANPADDPRRVKVARKAIGPEVALFVDANGAYGARQAIVLANRFAEEDVSWFEEPVSSDRLADLCRVRGAVPPGIDIAAGEYGYDSPYFRNMLESRAVDVLQLDATRCKGFSGFLEGAAVAASFGCPLSAHCAPTLHMHIGCCVPNFRHVEYFHDHARIEQMLFDGFIAPGDDGRMHPDRSRPGLGIAFKRSDANRFAD